VVRVKRGADDRHYETVTSPVFDEMGAVVQAIMVTRDVTDEKRLEERIETIYKAGREATSLDPQAMSRMTPADRMKIIRDKIGKHTLSIFASESFVIRQLDERTNQLETVIVEGSKIPAALRPLKAERAGSGVSGYVADSGSSYLVRDSVGEPLFVDEIGGARSSITAPLRLGERVIGTINVQSRSPDAFTAQDLKFLEIYADYVAIALNTANLLNVEYQAAFGKVAARLAHEIENPLNAVAAAVKVLRDEYIGHDSGTNARFREIELQMTRIREAIRKVTTLAELPPGEADSAPEAELEGKSILVADDDREILRNIADILTKLGSKVETAEDGHTAIEMACTKAYDVVISDIKMPKKNGYEVFSEVRAASPSTAVILMTAFGYDPNHSIVQARQEGLEVVLFKPFKVGVLKKEILRALRGTAGAK
jgi:CheY-like chemotaxis protein/GAF domain-containing protein